MRIRRDHRLGSFGRGALPIAGFLAVACVGIGAGIAQGAKREAAPELPSAAEIALARSAAPPSISGQATVYVLRNGRYEVGEKGSNGFTCLVLRDEDPRSQYPVCLDPEWTRCELPEYMKTAEMRRQGLGEDRIWTEVQRLRAKGEFPNPQRSGIAYMASQHMRGMFDVVKDGRIQPHVMIYAPGATNAQIGVASVAEARRRHIPFVANEGLPNAHILSPLMTYTDGTRFEDK